VIEVSRVSIELDLSPLSHWLSAQGIEHRIVEEQGEQVLYLDQKQSEWLIPVRSVLRRYVMEPAFRLRIAQLPLPSLPEHPVIRTPYPRVNPAQAPALFLVLVVALIAAVVTGFGSGGPALRALLIVDPMQLDFRMTGFASRWDGLLEMLAQGQWWRLLSPDFIHFNSLHLIFNALMCWVLGGQLELRLGGRAFLALLLFASVVSNLAQFLSAHYLFGGLSGVVYALVGFSWYWARHEPDVFMPDFLFRFSLVWLVLGYTPVTVWLGIGQMANEAHLFGLLSGLLWARLTLKRL
jgi:GlpG protein